MKAMFVEPFLFLPKPYTLEQLTKSVAFLMLAANPRPRLNLPDKDLPHQTEILPRGGS
jgi:hypothetical protein